MGGSGGSDNYSQINPEAVLRQAEAELRQQEALAEINEFLAEELRAYNDRDVETAKRRLDEIEEALGDTTEGVDRLLFGGSVAKHTYVDGLSDVDALVVLRGERPESPSQLLNDFAEALRAALPSSDVAEVGVGRLAVTVTYADGTEIQLLPTQDSGGSLSIASEDGQGWREIRPRKFAEKLTQVNQADNNGVVPAIKLAKGLFDRHLPEDQRLSGYHLEAVAVDAFRSYQGPTSREAMLRHLVDHASRAILAPTGDITGQSVHIDSHLGAAGSTERNTIAASIRRIDADLSTADNVAAYRDLFRD